MSDIIVKEEIENICRICLIKYSDNDHTIFDELQKDGLRIDYFLMSFTKIELQENDGLPHYICNDCLSLIQSAFNLYQLCNKSQIYFSDISYVGEPEIYNDTSEMLSTADETMMTTSVDNNEVLLNKTVAFNHNPDEIINSLMSKQYACLETNPNVKRQFDYAATYIEKTSKTGKPFYECVKCKQFFNCCPDDFKRHYDIHLEPFYRCKVCNRVFHRQYSFKCHLALCREEPNQPVPQKVIINTEVKSDRKPGELETNPDVKRNIDFNGKFTVKFDNNLKRYACNECGKSYKDFFNFTKHYNDHIDPFYICTQCQKTFSCQVKFKLHLETHSDQRYMCELCGNVYKNKLGFQEHTNMHNNIRMHCPLCDKSFFRKSDFSSHKKAHSNVRPYICTYCGAGFKMKSGLNHHERAIHQGIKPHKCDQCDMSFSSSHSLRKHLLTHMDNPPLIHGCDQCDKRFKTIGNLRQHQQSHMEKRFQCELCLKKFTQRHSLRSHMKICAGPLK